MSEYLDRKQVIELYEKYQPSLATHVYEFGEKLKALPIVKERPHGEWIPKAVHNCWTRFECSVCGYYHEPVHDFGESKPDFNFCPNCGADMRGEAE